MVRKQHAALSSQTKPLTHPPLTHTPQVAVNTSITDVRAFLDHIAASTNMRVLTPPRALEGDCGYLAANLYAR
jgi:hypothetical protein